MHGQAETEGMILSCWEYLRAKYRTDQKDLFLHTDDIHPLGSGLVCDGHRPRERPKARERRMEGAEPELDGWDETETVS